MTTEARPANSTEQDPQAIQEIRDGIRAIYDRDEVKEAIVNTFLGKVDEYPMEQFMKWQQVVLKKPDYVFHFHPLEPSYYDDNGRPYLDDNLGEYGTLKLYRYKLSGNGEYTNATSRLIDASSPHRIRVIEYDDGFTTDENSPRIHYYDGDEAIAKAREMIASYNQQALPVS